MNYQTLLDQSIIETPPPFPGIETIIGAERRRRRARRVGAGVGAVAGVVAVSLTVGTFIGAPAQPTPIPPQASSSMTASPGTVADIFQSRLSTVYPGSEITVDRGGPAPGSEGYETTFVRLWVRHTGGTTELTMTVLKSLAPGPVPTAGVLGRIFGGCAGMWSDATPAEPGSSGCQERGGPGGSTISYGDRSDRTSVAMAVMITPTGDAVVATAIETVGPTASWRVFGEDLAYVVSDLGYLR